MPQTQVITGALHIISIQTRSLKSKKLASDFDMEHLDLIKTTVLLWFKGFSGQRKKKWNRMSLPELLIPP